MNKIQTIVAVVLGATIALNGCDKSKDKSSEQKPQARPTLITTAQVTLRPIQIVEKTVGQVESQAAPVVAAEIAGRVVAVHGDVGRHVMQGQLLAELDDSDYKLARDATQAEVQRVTALIRSQEKQVGRYLDMVKEKFVTQSVLEEAEAQLDALREQLSGARVRLASAEQNLGKARVSAPVGGQIEARNVAVGDYVSVGAPLFKISTKSRLRVVLPFPESVVPRIRTGLVVRLTTPTVPDKAVEGTVTEIRPMIGTANRAVDVIVEVNNPGNWRPGASVNGLLILEEQPQAVTVPEQSVVKRPAGNVVYVIKDGLAEQRIVTTGARQEGWTQILTGLSGGEVVALDGAGYLTDKTPVSAQEPRP